MACPLVSIAELLPLAAAGDLGRDGAGWIEALLFAMGAGALASVALAPAALLTAWVLGERDGARRLGAVAGLVLIYAGAAAVAAHWGRHHDPRVATIGVITTASIAPLTGLAVVRATKRFIREGSKWPRHAAWLPCAAAAVIWLALPDHIRSHEGVGWALLVAALLPLAEFAPAKTTRGRALGLLAISVASIAYLGARLGADAGITSSLLRSHAPVRLAASLGQRGTDFDGDGASALFGGRDCAPFNAEVAPGRAEIAGNGIDDNCIGGDLDEVAPSPAPLRTGPPAPQLSGMNVLVLSIDAIRPDRMSIYGYERPTTPQLSRHFAGAFRFTAAYAEASSTRDTIPSVLSGRRRVQMLWHRHGAVVLDPRNELLGHWLRDAGYARFAVLPFVAMNTIGSPQLGFETIDEYEHRLRVSAGLVNQRLLARIDAAPGPFFAMAHYSEPHEPYRSQRDLTGVSSDPYDQEIAKVDQWIGRLMTQLEQRHRLDDTIIVVLGDHGEAFGEHGQHFHNGSAYEEQLRVPLLIRVPGVEGSAIAAPVSTTAVAATILELLDLAPGQRPPTVPSLWGLMNGAPGAMGVEAISRATLDHERFAIRRGTNKVIFDRALAFVEVYDLAADPEERHNLTGRDPDRVRTMVEHARVHLEQIVGRADSDDRSVRVSPLPDHARLDDPIELPGATIVGVEAVKTNPVTAHGGLPARVLVRTFFRAAEGSSRSARDAMSYRVRLRDGSRAVVSVTGIPFRGRLSLGDFPPGSIVEDVRTFKVYADDVSQTVELVAGGRSVELGPVRALNVWAPLDEPAQD
jgi:arylsulfatase A-like enzyme